MAAARRCAGKAAAALVFGALPAGIFLGVLVAAATRGSAGYGLEFRGNLWRPGRRIFAGLSPYEPHRLDVLAAAARDGKHEHAVAALAQAVYPAPTHVLAAPFALLPFQLAMALFAALSIAAVVGALWLLGVRDWRCYGVVFASVEVIQGIKLGGITPFLLFALAMLWRYRDDLRRCVPAAAVAVAAKLFLWPLVLWLLATGRRVTAWWTIAAALGAALSGWALIGFRGLTGYPHLLATLAALEQHHGESLIALGIRAGLDPTTSRLLAGAIGIALLAAMAVFGRRGREVQALGLALAAAFTLTPIVWTQYYMLMFAPLAIIRPRLGLVWGIPLLVWLVPVEVDAAGAELAHLAVLASTVVVTLLAAERGTGHGAAPESNRPSDGLRRLTRFEDALGHRARPLRSEI